MFGMTCDEYVMDTHGYDIIKNLPVIWAGPLVMNGWINNYLWSIIFLRMSFQLNQVLWCEQQGEEDLAFTVYIRIPYTQLICLIYDIRNFGFGTVSEPLYLMTFGNTHQPIWEWPMQLGLSEDAKPPKPKSKTIRSPWNHPQIHIHS